MLNDKGEDRIGQDEFYNLVTGNEVSWQAIIYDLINTEQLDPWDIDLAILTKKYLEKIKELEEANFFVSSKVLLAASLLLRIKSEILLNRYLKSLDDILFGKKDKTTPKIPIHLDLGDIPELFLKTPLPRYKKVSLQELVNALEKAISTENRRIKKEIVERQAHYETDIVLPKKTTNVRETIRLIYAKIITSFKKKQAKISYSELTNNDKEEKRICFLPILHLDSQHKVFIEQEKHLDEIYLWVYKHYKKENGSLELKEELVEGEITPEEKTAGIDNPLANLFEDLEKETINQDL
jgi:segregation and condensation protein A